MTDGAAGAAPKRRKPYKLTKDVREAFLAQLAATAHVEQSAAAVGLCDGTVYDLRRRDAAFAHEWRMALLMGYDRIEAALIRKALGLRDHAPVVDAVATGVAPEIGQVDVGIAMLLLNRHKPTIERATHEAKDAAFRSSRDDTEATLLAKLRAYAKSAGVAQDAEHAKLEAERGVADRARALRIRRKAEAKVGRPKVAGQRA